MKLDNFLEFDAYQVIFPEVQDIDIRKFAEIIKKIIGQDAIIVRKATNNYRKLSFKNKDIEYIEIKNSIKGLYGLLVCLYKFDELIEVKGIKKLHRFEIPKEIRELADQYYEIIKDFYQKFKNKKSIPELKLKDLSSSILVEIKKTISKKGEISGE